MEQVQTTFRCKRNNFHHILQSYVYNIFRFLFLKQLILQKNKAGVLLFLNVFFIFLRQLKGNLYSIIFKMSNIMAEAFRFIYLAFRFSQVENISLSAWVSQVQHERRCSRAWRGCVMQRCQNKNPRSKMGPGGVNGVMQEACAEDFRGF